MKKTKKFHPIKDHLVEDTHQELQEEFAHQSMRLVVFGKFLRVNEGKLPTSSGTDTFNLAEDAWVGKAMMRHEIRALVNILIELNLITADEYVRQCCKVLEEYLNSMQTKLGCQILTNAVVMKERDGEGQESSQQQSTDGEAEPSGEGGPHIVH